MDLSDLLAELACGDDQRAEAAVAEIAARAKTQRQPVMAALTEMLGDPDPDLRWWAARALASIDDPGVPALLSDALQDEDTAVRQCAALGLRLQPSPQALPALVALLGESDRLCAKLAADALTAIGEPAVQPLLQVMQDGTPPARVEAVRALALIGDPRAIPALFAALNEDSALIEYWAEQGLERMGVGMIFFTPG